MPIVVAEISQYITKKYDLEYIEISNSAPLPDEISNHQTNEEIKNHEIAKLEMER